MDIKKLIPQPGRDGRVYSHSAPVKAKQTFADTTKDAGKEGVSAGVKAAGSFKDAFDSTVKDTADLRKYVDRISEDVETAKKSIEANLKPEPSIVDKASHRFKETLVRKTFGGVKHTLEKSQHGLEL